MHDGGAVRTAPYDRKAVTLCALCRRNLLAGERFRYWQNAREREASRCGPLDDRQSDEIAGQRDGQHHGRITPLCLPTDASIASCTPTPAAASAGKTMRWP